MTEAEADQQLRDFLATQPVGPEWRTCAVCLCSVERATYSEHMEQAHGYTTITLTTPVNAVKRGGYMSLIKTAADAVLGFVITFGGSLITLLSQDGVSRLSDISQSAYVSAFMVASVATAKLVQSRLAEPPEKGQ